MKRLLLWPSAAWLGVFFALPLGLILLISLSTRGADGGVAWTASPEAWLRLADGLYLSILARSLGAAALNTALCALISFPVAYWMARAPKRLQGPLVLLILIPFWTNILVRLYAWMFILGYAGPLNAAAAALGLIGEPMELLFTRKAVLLGLVYEHLPFMILPLYAAMEKIDWSLVDAARDLYATSWGAFWRVVAPLSAPGLAAGSILVFVWTLGNFITPDLLGGAKHLMVGNLIQQQYLVLRDWPFGSALSLLVMLVTAGGIVLHMRQERRA